MKKHPRTEVLSALRDTKLLDFAAALANATAAFEEVIVEQQNQGEWKAVAGYRFTEQRIRIICAREVSVIANKKKSYIVETEMGSFWVMPDQIIGSWVVLTNYTAVTSIAETTTLIPETGY